MNTHAPDQTFVLCAAAHVCKWRRQGETHVAAHLTGRRPGIGLEGGSGAEHAQAGTAFLQRLLGL